MKTDYILEKISVIYILQIPMRDSDVQWKKSQFNRRVRKNYEYFAIYRQKWE